MIAPFFIIPLFLGFIFPSHACELSEKPLESSPIVIDGYKPLISLEDSNRHLVIRDPRTKAVKEGQNAGVWMRLENRLKTGVRIVRVTSDIAKNLELHTHIKDGDIVRMRPINAIGIPAEGAVDLKCGGLHIMLISVAKDIEGGDTFPITLHFDQGQPVTFFVKAERPKCNRCH
jgi:copper(I)-binding protein